MPPLSFHNSSNVRKGCVLSGVNVVVDGDNKALVCNVLAGRQLDLAVLFMLQGSIADA